MTSLSPRLLPLGLCLATGCLLAAEPPEKRPAKPEEVKLETFKGKVVPLADLLKKFGAELDAEAAPHWLALQMDDGKIYPLIKDAGGQTFYHVPRLLHRPIQIQGRVFPGTQLLQVVQVHTLKEGKLHEVYYWCEVCSIKRFSLEKNNVCECCGGPMELREVSVP